MWSGELLNNSTVCSQLICRNLRDFVIAVQLFTLDASADQDEEEAGQQAEEDGHRSQEERGAVLDAEMESRAARGFLVEGKLIQSVQDLDPHQIHHHHDEQTHA